MFEVGNHPIQLQNWVQVVEGNGNPSFVKGSQTYRDWFDKTKEKYLRNKNKILQNFTKILIFNYGK